jgi:hypothetical protein
MIPCQSVGVRHSMRVLRGLGAPLLVAALCACGSSGGHAFVADAGSDGSNDVSPAPASDGGGPTWVDASHGAPDATPDAAEAEAAPPPDESAPAVACSDGVPDVYQPPGGLPPMSPAHRGDVVRCAPDSTLSTSDVTTALQTAGVTGAAVKSGVNLYRIGFRTERGNGSEGMSSARVYLPQAPKSSPLPVIVVAHPTVGLAASCTPSMSPTSLADLALPWAGVQGYLVNRDPPYATLDAARALRKLLDPGAVSSQVLVVGYSQGGGAALSAQALARSYGADGDLVGVIVFAAEWPSRIDSFGYVNMLRDPTVLTVSTGLSKATVAVLREFEYFSNSVGLWAGGEGFPSASQAATVGAINSLCEVPLGGWLDANTQTVGDLIDDTLRTTFLACVDSGGVGCTDPGKSYYEFLDGNILKADPGGASILYVQGLLDQIMLPAEEAACNIAKLTSDGAPPQVCVDLAAVHTDVVKRNVVFAIQWGEAILAGTSLPSCAGDGMPACTP